MIENSRIYNDLQYTELELGTSIAYEDDYQVQMISENTIPHLLKVAVSGKDSGSLYSYDITGLKSVKMDVEKEPITQEYIQVFLQQLLNTIHNMTNYMLNRNCILLNPEYIFVKDEEFFFCYYPVKEEPISESFHNLTEFFVKEIDYSDYPSVILACGLHKETMSVQYGLTDLIRKYTQVEAEEMKEEGIDFNYEREKLQREETLWMIDTDDAYSELEDVDEEESIIRTSSFEKMKNVIKETSVHRYWDQRKKEKWGTWDDLLSQEESSIIEKG